MSGNDVTITGNATRGPELRFSTSGRATATFGIAVNRRWQNKTTNEWEEAVSFFNVVCWGDLAENAASCVDKGTRVIVTGRLEQRSWETESGDKRSVIEIVADEIGPSLRWATAEVTRNERGDRAATGRAVANEPPAGYSDEEPFRLDVGIDDIVPQPLRRRLLGGA